MADSRYNWRWFRRGRSRKIWRSLGRVHSPAGKWGGRSGPLVLEQLEARTFLAEICLDTPG